MLVAMNSLVVIEEHGNITIKMREYVCLQPNLTNWSETGMLWRIEAMGGRRRSQMQYQCMGVRYAIS